MTPRGTGSGEAGSPPEGGGGGLRPHARQKQIPPRQTRHVTKPLILVLMLLLGHATCMAAPNEQTVQGRVNREGKETFPFTFAATGTVTVELSGFPPDCIFQIGSQGFQESDTSPLDWTDGRLGSPMKHTFRAQAGKPGIVWVELRSLFSRVNLGDWSGVICSKDGPCYTTPERGKPVVGGPADFEGLPVRPPITFRLTALMEGAAVASTPAKSATLRDDALKFAFDYPEGWAAVRLERDGYRVSGAVGTPEEEASIMVKVITKAANPDTSDSRLLLKAHEQLTGDGAQLEKLGPANLGGQEAAFASHTYDGGNAAGKKVPFDHVQLVLDHGANYYLVSFVAPHDVFVNQAVAFKNVVHTWRFVP